MEDEGDKDGEAGVEDAEGQDDDGDKEGQLGCEAADMNEVLERSEAVSSEGAVSVGSPTE